MARTQEFSLEITCQLDDEYFLVWDELKPEIKAFWESTNDTPHCEGEGNMGAWCRDCPFCTRFEVETI